MTMALRIVATSVILLIGSDLRCDAQDIASSFQFPLSSQWSVTQHRGSWNDDFLGFHTADDVVVATPPGGIKLQTELPVLAAGAGRVVHVAPHTAYGWVVLVEHTLPLGDPVGPMIQTLYAHLRHADIIRSGSSVSKGDVLGYLSSDPNENGGYTFTHLHFAVKVGGYSTVGCDNVTRWWPYAGYSTLFNRCNDKSTRIGSTPASPNWPDYQPSHDTFMAAWLNPTAFVLAHESSSTPTAGFTMLGANNAVGDGQTLTVPASSSGLAPVHLRAGCLTSSEGCDVIHTWAWAVSGVSPQPDPNHPSVQVSLPIGQHTVQLRVTDRQGRQSSLAVGTIVVTPRTVSPHQTIAVTNQAIVDLFNVDDVLKITLNGQPVGAAAYFEQRSFDLFPLLSPGSNILNIELENNPSAGWTFGFRIHADGNLAASGECGKVGEGGAGCGDEDHTAGIVFADTYTIEKGSVEGTTTPTTQLFYERNDNASVFGQPVIDSRGHLRVIRSIYGFSCSFGFCGMRLDAIAPDGTLSWESGDIPTDNLGSRGLSIGPGDRSYALGRLTIAAYERDGQPSPGWPIDAAPVNFVIGGFLVDQATATVYSLAGVTYSFSGFPSAIRATTPGGSPVWELTYPDGANLYGIVPGPGGRLFTITGGASSPSNSVLVGIDSADGTERCRTPASSHQGSLIGTGDGVFTALRGQVLSYDFNCQPHYVYTSDSGAGIELRGYAAGRLLAVEYPVNPNDLNPTRLVSIARDGSSKWTLDGVLVVSPNPVRAVHGSTLYIYGEDIEDGNRKKVFLVDASSGQVRSAIPADGLCAGTCGVVVAPDGTIYINDLDASTRIFRVQ